MTLAHLRESAARPAGLSNSDDRTWSVWGIWLIAFVSVATALSLGWAWIDMFYRGVSVASVLSFNSNDFPWMPVHTSPVPIIGNHYFGDFQLPYAWGLNVRESISPYLGSAIPADYTPFAILFFTAFALIPVKSSAFLYLALTLVALLVPLWILLSPLDVARRCLVLAPLVLLTTPMAGILDRGNDFGFTIALVSLALLAWRSERWWWCGALLAAAIALKGYPIVLLVVPLALRRVRFAIGVAVAAVGANFLSLLVIPGGFSQNLHAAIPALTSQKLTSASQLDTWGLYSLIPKTIGLFSGTGHLASWLNPHGVKLWVLPIVYLAFVAVIVWRRRVPEWCWGPLSLASLQLVPPLSGVYTTGWALLAGVWFCVGSVVPETWTVARSDHQVSSYAALRILVGLAIGVTLVPSIVSFAGVGGVSIVATKYLSPLLLVAAVCLALTQSIIRANEAAELRT